jgi:predicted nuclease of predicted toxin-antitoxin system
VKLLLDENLPHELRTLLPGRDCYTATWMGWGGVSNGELLRLATDNGFDAFVTTDRGFEHQQNQAALPLAVVVLVAPDNKLATI